MKIKYVTGDLFEMLPYDSPQYKVIPHVCNNVGKWGSGFVVPLGKKWPATKEKYLEWFGQTETLESIGHTDEILKIGRSQIISGLYSSPGKHNDGGSIFVVNMVGQHGTVSPTNPRPIDYAALGSMMFDLPRKLNISGEKMDCEIHCPCFGAGLAGGNWDFIELLIYDAWIRQGLPVTVYQLEGQEVREPTEG